MWHKLKLNSLILFSSLFNPPWGWFLGFCGDGCWHGRRWRWCIAAVELHAPLTHPHTSCSFAPLSTKLLPHQHPCIPLFNTHSTQIILLLNSLFFFHPSFINSSTPHISISQLFYSFLLFFTFCYSNFPISIYKNLIFKSQKLQNIILTVLDQSA